MLLRTAWCSLILLLLLHVRASFGLPKDSGLIQLIPPQSSLIAGMTSSAAQGTTKSFLLVTHENTMDLKDFYALTGGDATRQLKALVFVTGARREAAPNEHSLLVNGQFDRDAIFRFSSAGARRGSYRGIPVLVVPPFEREQEAFDEVRWLAIPEGNIAIFGSVGSVQRELDRWIERATSDPILLGELRRLQGHDDSWCILLARDREGVAEAVLGKLDASLAAVAHEGGLIGVGIRFGLKVEIAIAADPYPVRSSKETNDSAGLPSTHGMHFLSTAPSESTGAEAVVKVSRQRYEKWIGEFDGPGH